MQDTLENASGLGLAAPQVNILKRMVIYDTHNFPNEDEVAQTQRFLWMINPVITQASEEETVLDERCFSVPDLAIPVSRPAFISVSFWDREGNTQTLQAKGLFAKCVQHEIDHLDGVLTIDYLSPLKKALSLKKLQKIKQRLRAEQD